MSRPRTDVISGSRFQMMIMKKRVSSSGLPEDLEGHAREDVEGDNR